MYKYKSMVSGNTGTWTVHYQFYYIVIWCINDIFLYRYDRSVTVHNRCSKIPPSIWMYIANLVRKSRFRLEVMIRFFMRMAASEKRGSSSSRVSTFHFFTPLFIQPHIQKSNRRNIVHIRASNKHVNWCNNTNKYTWIKYVSLQHYLQTCLYRFTV
jgi:hypothetical protein